MYRIGSTEYLDYISAGTTIRVPRQNTSRKSECRESHLNHAAPATPQLHSIRPRLFAAPLYSKYPRYNSSLQNRAPSRYGLCTPFSTSKPPPRLDLVRVPFHCRTATPWLAELGWNRWVTYRINFEEIPHFQAPFHRACPMVPTVPRLVLSCSRLVAPVTRPHSSHSRLTSIKTPPITGALAISP